MKQQKRWTPEEVDLLRTLRAGRVRAKIIAKRLGRSVASVLCAARHHAGHMWACDPGRVEAEVRKYPQTASAVLARRLGVHPSSVRRCRRRLGLGRLPMRVTKAVRQKNAKRAARDAAVCAADGWPVGCTTAVAAVLESIERGHARTPAMAADLGLHPTTVRDQLQIARRRGWVTKTRSGSHFDYALTPPVVARRARAEPGLVVCFGCNKIAPQRQDIEPFGWRSRLIRVAAGGRPIQDARCPLCFARYGWGDEEGGAA